MATNWDNVSYILRSKYRIKVLQYLSKLNAPTTPTKLKRELNIDKAHISRALQDLAKKDWVTCLTPEARKTKLFQITKSGIAIEKELESIKY